MFNKWYLIKVSSLKPGLHLSAEQVYLFNTNQFNRIIM